MLLKKTSMVIFFFPKYARTGASSRYRSYQYHTAIEAEGIHVVVSPLFDDAYLAHKYAKGHARICDIFRAFATRLWRVFMVKRGSLVFIEYELIPYCPAFFELWLSWRKCRMVVDYDDALFHQYDTHRNSWVRRFLGNKIANVMRLATSVIVGNAYLSKYAQYSGATRIYILPTVIDLMRYRIKDVKSRSPVFTIGWIGSPTTVRYLKQIAPALAEVCKGGRGVVCLIGSGPIDLPGLPLELIAWDEDTEVENIRRFDVGIMPLPDEPWTRGKCGFKLIQYMACGLPVVASPIGVNCEIVENGVNGYLATTTGEWIIALESLRADFELRIRMGLAGRRLVEEKYTLDVTKPRMLKLLEQCVD